MTLPLQTTAGRLELQLAASSVPSSSGLLVLDREKRVLNQARIHPTGRETPERTCLSANISSFRVYLKPLEDSLIKVSPGNLELGISAPSL